MITPQQTNYLLRVACNLLGSYADAQDIVQDVTLKYLETNPEDIQSENAYLVRMTVNSCLNSLKKRSRMEYVGLWLPEPTVSHVLDAEYNEKETRDTLTYELLFLLERVSPKERAVFVLREAFGYSYDEIAEILPVTPENARQLMVRCRKKIAGKRHESLITPSHQRKAELFVQLIATNDLEGLTELLTEDITVISDGGGHVNAARVPVTGQKKVAGFFLNIARMAGFIPRVTFGAVLGQPAIYMFREEQLIAVYVLSIADEKIARIYISMNPEKLG